MPKEEFIEDEVLDVNPKYDPKLTVVKTIGGNKYEIMTTRETFRGVDKFLKITAQKQVGINGVKNFGKKLFKVIITSKELQTVIPKTPSSVVGIEIALAARTKGTFSKTIEEVDLIIPYSSELPDLSATNIIHIRSEDCKRITKIDGSKLPENLQSLVLKNTNLSVIPDNLPKSLKYIILSDANITTVPDLSSFEDLEVISLNGNKIKHLPKQSKNIKTKIVLFRNPIKKSTIPKEYLKISMEKNK